MSDIADKIYAATGLTLNAEAAAKVGHMIRLARQEATNEIEKLRDALDKISKLNARRDRYSQEVEDVIIAALGEKE